MEIFPILTRIFNWFSSTSPIYDELKQAVEEVRKEQNTPPEFSRQAKPYSGRYSPTLIPELEKDPEYTSAIDTECVTFSLRLLQNLSDKGIEAHHVLVKELSGNQAPEFNHMMVYSNGYYMDNNSHWPRKKSDLAFYEFKVMK